MTESSNERTSTKWKFSPGVIGGTPTAARRRHAHVFDPPPSRDLKAKKRWDQPSPSLGGKSWIRRLIKGAKKNNRIGLMKRTLVFSHYSNKSDDWPGWVVKWPSSLLRLTVSGSNTTRAWVAKMDGTWSRRFSRDLHFRQWSQMMYQLHSIKISCVVFFFRLRV